MIENEEEIWRNIPDLGTELIEVSNLGRLRSSRPLEGTKPVSKPIILRGAKHKYTGYTNANVTIEGKRKNYGIHQLVLRAFVGPCPEKYETCHLNGYRSDNRVSNLKWGSRKENASHRKLHGTQQYLKGELNGQAKLTEKEVKEIRRLNNITISGLAKRYDVCFATIKNIKTRQNWKHL